MVVYPQYSCCLHLCLTRLIIYAETDGELIRMVQQQSLEAYYQQSQRACGGFLMPQKQMLI